MSLGNRHSFTTTKLDTFKIFEAYLKDKNLKPILDYLELLDFNELTMVKNLTNKFAPEEAFINAINNYKFK